MMQKVKERNKKQGKWRKIGKEGKKIKIYLKRRQQSSNNISWHCATRSNKKERTKEKNRESVREKNRQIEQIKRQSNMSGKVVK